MGKPAAPPRAGLLPCTRTISSLAVLPVWAPAGPTPGPSRRASTAINVASTFPISLLPKSRKDRKFAPRLSQVAVELRMPLRCGVPARRQEPPGESQVPESRVSGITTAAEASRRIVMVVGRKRPIRIGEVGAVEKSEELDS